MNKKIKRICHLLANPADLISILRLKYRWIFMRILEACVGDKIIDFKQVPIIINNFNQLSYLKQLIHALEIRGYKNIHIIDNNSTYPPLLEFYKSCPYEVYELGRNVGYKALWETDIFKKFRKGYYVYTDSDVVPTEECPDNFIEYFYSILQKYKRAQKVGFSLKTDDLPDFYRDKQKVISWEAGLYKKELENNVFEAQIDTTFALYRPFAHGEANFVEQNIRLLRPFEARHMPWYTNSEDITEEQKYYIAHCKVITHWSEQMKNKTR